jgi:hypothetical protein
MEGLIFLAHNTHIYLSSSVRSNDQSNFLTLDLRATEGVPRYSVAGVHTSVSTSCLSSEAEFSIRLLCNYSVLSPLWADLGCALLAVKPRLVPSLFLRIKVRTASPFWYLT